MVETDPDDDIFINTALDGRADYVVSGDRDLLNQKEYRGIKIVKVDEMLGILQSNG